MIGFQWQFLDRMKRSVVGLEPLAIAFSLSYTLLMWSVYGFFVALLIFSFQNTSKKIWIPVGTAVGIVIGSMVWCSKNTVIRIPEDEEPMGWPSQA